MKIVILDGNGLNPGDLSWDGFHKLGQLQVYDRTAPEQVLERVGDAQIVITNKTVLDAAQLTNMPWIRYIGLLSTGTNAVDIDRANQMGIVVTNVPAYSTASVAQMTFALLLELCSRVGLHSRLVSEGIWTNGKDFCFWEAPLVELQDKTMGIIGFGEIGSHVATIAKVFGMKVLFYNRSKKNLGEKAFMQVSLDELLSRSDVVSLHCPLTEQTRDLIDKEKLAKMKPSAFLINTARGPLINEQDLADALNHAKIAGAGLDVLGLEPPKPDNPLLNAKNCIITPHIAWATKEARTRLMEAACENLQAFLNNRPINVVK